jgi:hypothetical protein
MKKQVIREAHSQVKSYDEPLFVLKYQKRKVIPAFVLLLLFVGLITLMLLVAARVRSTAELIFVRSFGLLFLLAWGSFVAEMLLFKEIRLYRDRIVKVWRLD